MGFELPNGKTARNIQEQVKFLTEKVKELIARVNELELHIEIVDELPETGSSDAIYFVPVEDPEEGNYYNEYMWINDTWELIGTTQIDLSGYMTLNTDQKITSNKLIAVDKLLKFSSAAGDDKYFYIGSMKGNTFHMGAVGLATALALDSYLVSFSPDSSSSTQTIGTSSKRWKELYLSGKVDFGNDAYITKDQYNRITLNVSDNAKIVVDAGQTYVNNNLLPLTATRDLGSNDYKWKNLYLNHALYLNDASGTNSGITITPKTDGATITAFSLMLASDYLYTYSVKPYSGDSFDLGGNDQRWRDVYISRNLTDGTNTVSVAQLASGIGGTYRHVIYIEGSSADINIAVNLNSATAITTQAALAAINNNVMGGTATLDTQSTYKIVAIDSVGTVGSIVYLDDTGQHTLNIVDIYQDVVNQI